MEHSPYITKPHKYNLITTASSLAVAMPLYFLSSVSYVILVGILAVRGLTLYFVSLNELATVKNLYAVQIIKNKKFRKAITHSIIHSRRGRKLVLISG